MREKLPKIDLESTRPLRELVSEAILDAIKSGLLSPGDRLMEIQLSEELGISRTPVREAIRLLESEGHVIMMPRRGAYVASLSIRDVNEVFEIRTSLESLASGLAASRITEAELERLQRLLMKIGKYTERGDMEKIVEADMEFHDLLYQASRNNRLVGIISNLREQMMRFRTESMSYPGRLKATLEEHRNIVEAIAAGDVKSARRAAERHMENSEKTLLARMENTETKED